MAETQPFAAEILRIIGARLRERVTDLGHLVEAEVPLDGWLESEAFLACRARQAESGFCEVTARPTYGSEGVTGDDGKPSAEQGGLRVGGSGEPGDHRWFFAEFVLLQDGERRYEDWNARTVAAITRLLRLGWKRSASVLIVVVAGRGDIEADWARELTGLGVWQRQLLTDQLRLDLPGGGTMVARAIDVKRNPADTLTKIETQV